MQGPEFSPEYLDLIQSLSGSSAKHFARKLTGGPVPYFVDYTVPSRLDPATGRPVMFVDYAKSKSPSMLVYPSADFAEVPLARFLQELKGKSVLFSPVSGPATKAQGIREDKLWERVFRERSRGTYDPGGLTKRALSKLQDKFHKDRIKLFEEMVGGGPAKRVWGNTYRLLPVLALMLLVGLAGKGKSDA